jgi:hypothetical protein
MAYNEAFKTWPESGKAPGYDLQGRLLPLMPTKPFLMPSSQYREGTELKLLQAAPLDEHISSKVPLKVRIKRQINVGFGKLRQVVECIVTESSGHPTLRPGSDIVALIFDQLYVSMFDLNPMPQNTVSAERNEKLEPVSTVTHPASMIGTTVISQDSKKVTDIPERVPLTRQYTGAVLSKLFGPHEKPVLIFIFKVF